jgi:hypothetical protein
MSGCQAPITATVNGRKLAACQSANHRDYDLYGDDGTVWGHAIRTVRDGTEYYEIWSDDGVNVSDSFEIRDALRVLYYFMVEA